MNAIVFRPAYQNSTMHISFPNDAPIFDGANLRVEFTAVVDREPIVCAITAEALEDHFGATSALEAHLTGAFEQGRARIRSVCAEALDRNGGTSVILHSGLFRIDGMA